VLSRTISLEGQLFPIIGITPEDFYGVEVGRNFDVAVPLCAEPLLRGEDANYGKRDGWWLSLLGRLRPGWNMAQAAAQLRSISPEIFKETLPPKFDTDDAKHYLGYQLGAFPAGTGLSELRRDYENPLWLLLGLAALVLLIACANLANLMLARAAGRQREFGVRLVVGASRVRLVRQLLAESLLLAAIGAGVGAWIARGLSRFLVAFLSTSHNPLFMDLRADGRVFGFTAALAVFTCLLFGLIPALRATALAPADALRSGGRNSTAGRERFGLRRALVSAQVALTLVLLVGALLFSRSLRNLAMVDAGFREQGILIADFDTTPLKLPPAERLAFRQRLLERVRGVPGVLAAAETRIVPLSGNGWNRTVDAKSPGAGKTTTAQLNRISPDYFRTMETPLLAGRDFDQRDAVGAPKVAIVNQTFARVFLGEENPVGKSFQFKVETGAPEPVFQIVGLVRDSKYSELREDSVLIAYFPMAQDEQPSLDSTFVIRSALPPNSLRSALRSPFEEASPEIQISFQVMDTMVQQTMLRERLMATLSGFFGLLAGVLATIGIYGVISYTVAQRRGEFGIRMALGADRGRIVSMILGEAAVLLGVGLTAGTVITLLAVRAVGSMLFGLRPDDPPTLLIAVALLAVVGAAASCFPAVRASRLDPTEALRAE